VGRSDENTGFQCAHCGRRIEPVTNGGYRNHCPFCLWSKHVDRAPGDRANRCRGLMRPIGLRRTRKGWQLVHRCERCGAVRVNIVAERTVQPDDFERLGMLSVRCGGGY
jgi:Zn finger protein HypA/HybF involved in hydrogenase expression